MGATREKSVLRSPSLRGCQRELLDGQSLDVLAATGEAEEILALDQRNIDRRGLVPHADREGHRNVDRLLRVVGRN